MDRPQESAAFKQYYNAAMKRFPRPEPLDQRTIQQHLNRPADQRYEEYSTRSSGRPPRLDQADSIDLTSLRHNNETMSDGYNKVPLVRSERTWATNSSADNVACKQEIKNGFNKGSVYCTAQESVPQGLLPDVEDTHVTIYETPFISEVHKLGAQICDPVIEKRGRTDYTCSKKSATHQTHPKLAINTNSHRAAGIEKATQCEHLSEERTKLQQTVAQLQDQLTAALALLRQYVASSGSEAVPLRRAAAAPLRGDNASPAPAPDPEYSASPRSLSELVEEEEEGASPVFAKESATANQLIHLAANASPRFDGAAHVSGSDWAGGRSRFQRDARAQETLAADHELLKQRMQAMDDFVASVVKDNDRLSQELAAAYEALAALRADCAALRRVRAGLESERDAAAAARAAAERDRAGLQAEGAKLIEALDGACRERAALAARLDAATEELCRAASRLRGSRAERDGLLERQVQMQVELDRFARWHRRSRRDLARLAALELEWDVWRRSLRDLGEELAALLRAVRQLLQSEVNCLAPKGTNGD